MVHYCFACGKRMIVGKEHHCKDRDIDNRFPEKKKED